LSHAQERGSDLEFALTTLGRLWLSGVRVNWRAFHADGGRRRVPLPTYPFERRRYWVEPARGARRALPERAERFSTPSWIRTEERLRPGRPSQRWLVLVDEQGFGAALARGLETLGRQVVEVRAGESFQRRGEADFVVNPRIQEDFESLARELGVAGFAPQGIVHCWSIAAEPDGGATALADGLELGLRALLRIARVFAGGPAAPSRAVILSNSLQSVTGDEWLAPTRAAILGLCGASLPEAPGLVFRNVDVVPPTRGGAAEARWVDALIAELDAEEAPAIDP
jgi:acyl transferase domain-containing protein